MTSTQPNILVLISKVEQLWKQSQDKFYRMQAVIHLLINKYILKREEFAVPVMLTHTY
jgi:hypothetical protein